MFIYTVFVQYMIFGFLLGDRARRSPRKLPTAMKEERKKWAMPKFLPHKYDVKLINEDKVCFVFLHHHSRNGVWSVFYF